jgi:hypothetical protein
VSLTRVGDLTPDDRKRLAKALECQEGELNAKLAACARAAMSEMLDMFLDRKILTRGAEIMEFRLFQLILAGVFKDTVPTDQNVADLFQRTLAQSRTLIGNVYTKYRFEVDQGREKVLVEHLESATADPNSDVIYRITIRSRTVRDAIDGQLLRLGGVARLTLVPGTQTQYAIDRAALIELCNDLNATPPPNV